MISNSAKAIPFFVLVLGSHRSGSSVTTKILQSLGCNLGSDLLGGDHSNAIGHFENLEVLEFNEKLLESLSTDWKNPAPLDQSSYYESNRSKIQNEMCLLLQNLLNQNINAIKEPRMSILLDAWEGAISRTIPNLKIIVTIRHPAEVASSLQKRNNLSHVIGVQLWVQSTLNAIRFAREHSNYIVFYDQLVSEPQEITRQIAQHLSTSNQFAKFSTLAAKDVVLEYRHNKVLDGELSVLNIATEMYEQILKYTSATTLNFPDELLDEWQKRINSTYKEVNRLELIRVTDLQKDRTIEDLWESRNAVELKLTLERDEIAADRDRIIQGLTSELTKNTSERDQIAVERDQIAADRDRITQHLTSERDQIATERDLITQALTLKRDEIARERDQISSERDQIAIERNQIKMDRDRITLELTSERDQLTSERDQLTSERDQLTSERDQLTSERDQLTSERDQLTSERDQLLNSTIWRATKSIRWFINLFKR